MADIHIFGTRNPQWGKSRGKSWKETPNYIFSVMIFFYHCKVH
ncbi:MAG: hypothetical protein RLZZ520_1325, partial [Bacteroidota bacterium]